MESKPEAAQNLLCMACLCVEKALHELKSLDIVKYYLNCISEISVSIKILEYTKYFMQIFAAHLGTNNIFFYKKKLLLNIVLKYFRN